MMKDVCLVTELLIMMTTLLQRQEQLPKAEKIYDFLRNFLCETNQYKYLVEVYFKTNELLQELKRFKTAIKVCKSLLAIAWCTDDQAAEIKVYEQLALCYYYTQEMKTSLKYKDRFMGGKVESNQSPTKILCLRTALGQKNGKIKYFQPTIQRTTAIKIVSSIVNDYQDIENAISDFTEARDIRQSVD